ncbi:hypothetical protein L7F22_013407 [Adiantum nelumboides]|nr:hypothetical protein [Adiantum nelumboides]
MDLFRSEEMNLAQLIIPVESAHHTMTYLGDLGLFQFKDLNSDKSPFQRAYAKQVKRCGEMLRKVRFLKDQLAKAGISGSTGTLASKEIDIDELEVKLTELEIELTNINSSSDILMRSYSELLEFQLVLQKAGMFFYSAQSNAHAQQRELEESSSFRVEESIESPLLLEQEMLQEPSKQARLGFIAGLVAKSKASAFERILFRATRGNVLLKQAPVEEPVLDPATGDKMEKIVFLVFFSGERAKLKIMKICEAFGANKYPFPEDAGKQAQMLDEVCSVMYQQTRLI